jgi:sugar phosphate isomerase/epimerase
LKGLARAGVTAAVTTAILSCAAVAQAQTPHPDLGNGVPSGQMGVQLYNWSQYLSNGAGEIVCPAEGEPTPNCVAPPAPGNSAARLQRVFEFLASKNVRNVELYGYPGNPFPNNTAGNTGNIQGMMALRAQGDALGLRFVSRHGSLSEANWDNHIMAAKILGQEVIGAADPPNAGSTNVQTNLNNAALMNRLGKRAVEAGVGPAYFHNHANSFNAMVNDNGVMKRQWQFLMDHTDPRYVKAQIDIGWAVSGSSQQEIETYMGNPEYRKRVISFHVKDVNNPRPGAGTGDLRELGNGSINFSQIFANSKHAVRWYLYEYDPVTPGNNGGFNPFNSAETSFNNMRGAPEGVAYAPAVLFDPVPAGTRAADNAKDIAVKNIGDAPLVVANSAPTITADEEDGGAATAADFQVISDGCRNSTVAPGESCTIRVGFGPRRIAEFSSAILHVPSNGDDAMDKIPLYGTSTNGLIDQDDTEVGGTVPATLAVSLPSTGAVFNPFIPGVAETYESSIAANITTSAADATLTVADPSSVATGHLVNGTFSLPSPLQAKATSSAGGTGGDFANVGGSANPTTLLTYSGPVANDAVTVSFRQAIGATDALRTGTYSKTLTFTLSTTTP